MIRQSKQRNLLLPLLAVMVLATPVAADTFRIEIDYMVEEGGNAHSHMPTPEEIDAVVQMFACQGHTLIVDVSTELEHHRVLIMDPNVPFRFFDYDGIAASFGRIKSENFDHAGDTGWHYCVFAHQYQWIDENGLPFDSDSSGLAEMSGDDLIVTLGTFDYNGLPTGSPFQKAATLAHEFGHNLGLGHCGDMECGRDDTVPNWVGPRAPNLASVMSYFYQLNGVRTVLVATGIAPEFIPFKDLDYSHGTMCSLNENALNEALGTLMAPVDWNCNGSYGGTWPQDLDDKPWDGWCAGGLGTLSVLSDYDEWAHISDPLKYYKAADLVNREVAVCISSHKMKDLFGQMDFDKTTLLVEPCLTAEMRYVRSVGSSQASGDCTDSFDTVEDAATGAPVGSVILVEPGTWNEGPVILDEQAILHSAGSAVIR